MAEVIRRLGLATNVELRGRIFYDACVINRYRLSDTSLYGGPGNEGIKMFAEYSNMDFNPMRV